MKIYRVLLAGVKALLLLAILGVAFTLLAPAPFGGRTSYVVVTGNSMEPTLYRGDLAILRRTDDYQVGDVVTYRHPSIGLVIHRILERRGDRFVLQGDNNSWQDAYEPTKSDIQGELMFHLPRAGSIVWGFRSPVGAALLTGVIGIFLFWSADDEPEAELESG